MVRKWTRPLISMRAGRGAFTDEGPLAFHHKVAIIDYNDHYLKEL